jgi:hypothetical protein
VLQTGRLARRPSAAARKVVYPAMPNFEKHFTVAEANAMLPELRELLLAIRQSREHLTVEWQNAAPVLRAAPMNGGGAEASRYVSELLRLNGLLRRVLARGVLLKDIDRGLVDFPHLRGEEEVLLCWELSEESVAFWHDLESGFRGRRPIEP